MTEFKDLVGLTLTSISGATENSEEVLLFAGKRKFRMHHCQDCCESVSLNEVIGDVNDLVGTPILLAEEVSESGSNSKYGDTFTWTFYKLSTIKGSVTLRWLGSSNGYYSEAVDFEEVK